jgi:hypothetical protein
MKKTMCQMVLPLLSAFGVGFYFENLPAPVAVITRSGPSSSPPTGEVSKLHRTHKHLDNLDGWLTGRMMGWMDGKDDHPRILYK